MMFSDGYYKQRRATTDGIVNKVFTKEYHPTIQPETCEGAVLPNCTISRTGRVVIVQFDSSEEAESAYGELEKWAATDRPGVVHADLVAACRLLLHQLSRDEISVLPEDCDLPDPIAMIQQALQR